MKKTYPLTITFFLIIAFSLKSIAQCVLLTNVVSDVTLQCSGGTNDRSAVAFYPTQRVYYSVNQGSSSNPIETFSYTGGNHLSDTIQAVDYGGFWYNSNLASLEGNVFSQASVIQQSINPYNSFPLAITSLSTPAGIPALQSCGQYDPINNQVIYYHSSTLYKYNRTTGAFVFSITVTGLPNTTVNNTSLIYTGFAGSEVGLYDYVNKKIYYVNLTTGAYSGVCQLPNNAPAPSSLGLSYANNRLFLFDTISNRWIGYKLSNKPDIYFFGRNILCKFQEEYVFVGNPNNEITTFSWAPAYAMAPPTGSNNDGVAISQPTATTIYDVTVTNSAGCSASSNFVMTAYPNTINYNITMNGSADSTLCTNLTTITLTANGPLTYTWIPGGAHTSSIAVTPTTTTLFKVMGTDAMGCVSILRTHLFTIYGGPTVSAVANPTLVCDNQTATITANGAMSYTWNNGSISSSIIVNPIPYTAYSVLGENANGCKDLKSVWINTGTTPSLNPSMKVICNGKHAFLFVNSSNGPASYTWSTGEVNYMITVQPTITTSYTVFAESSSGCTNSAVATVTVNECVGVEKHTMEESQLIIYPNPSAGKFKITLNSISENSYVEVYSLTGQSVYREQFNTLENELDLTNLSNGLYMLVYSENNSHRITKKIIKQ
jgi:hypothetical protein